MSAMAERLFEIPATPKCIVCGERLTASEFTPDIRRPSGCFSRCKVCQRILRNAWNAKDPAGHLASVYRWRAKNVEKVLMARRRYQNLRRARKLGIEPAILIDPMTVFERDEGICGICSLPIDGAFHVDHIVPLAKGGPHTYENVQAAHPRCNIAKGAR